MTCEDCEKAEESGMIAYYRWGKANIGLIGCRTHLKEVMEALSKTQR